MNNWLWTKGRNTFNIGCEFRRAYQDDNEEQTAGGQFNFSQKHHLRAKLHRSELRQIRQCIRQLPAWYSGLCKSQQFAGITTPQRDFSPYIQDDIKL